MGPPVRTPAEGIPERRDQGEPERASTPVIAKGTHTDLAEQAAQAQREPAGDEDVASLVHDLRTPLSIIMLEAQLLETRLGTRATPAAQRGLERIAQNAAYIDRLVTNLLDLASVEAGRLELRLERVDLSRLLVDTLARAVSTVDRARVSIEIRDVLYVDADAARLERVIANLLGNALKFSTAPVTIRLDKRGPSACIAVIDAGPGMTAEQAQRVFERYRSATPARTHDGYGLGLHICKRIIDAHGGRLAVTSTPGKGSRFYFELRCVPGPQPPRSG